MFVLEREAHEALIKVLDEVEADEPIPSLPPIVVHCSTGSEAEAQEYNAQDYSRHGYYIPTTG